MPSSAFKTCARSEEHTSELQSHDNLVCRLLLEKKMTKSWEWRFTTPHHGHSPTAPAQTRRATHQPGGGEGRGRSPDGHPEACQRCFFFKNAGPPEIYTLSLPDPLPI